MKHAANNLTIEKQRDDSIDLKNVFPRYYSQLVDAIQQGSLDDMRMLLECLFGEAHMLPDREKFSNTFEICRKLIQDLLDPRLSKTIKISFSTRTDIILLSTGDDLESYIKLSFLKYMIAIQACMKKQKSNPHYQCAMKAIDLIEQQYSNPDLTLESVASQLFVSYGHLCSIFKEIAGMGFRDYLVMVRMEEAKKLLITERYSIKDISEIVGYNSIRYFYSIFSGYFNMTPTELIKENRRWLVQADTSHQS